MLHIFITNLHDRPLSLDQWAQWFNKPLRLNLWKRIEKFF
jgi:hypothetical protein